PGTHTITARAFDRAENSVESKATFTIGSLQPPQITEYPKSVIVGDSIIIKGVTSPYSDVTIWCEGVADSVFANNKIDVASTTSSVKNYLDRHSHIVRADKDGVFVLEHPKIDIPGVYTAWAEVVDANGEKSTPSDKIVIKVNRAGSPLFSGAGAGGTLIFIVLLIIAWYVRSTFFLLRNKLHKEVNEAQKASEKAFALLQEEVTEHIKEIEKAKEDRVLTKEEEKALKRFKKNLKDAEKFVKKEIDDIEDLLV
ncbi:MAG: hypothetical protein HZC04_01955, partial [Candidatus Lloydbacteria bacterium]|nr:hypothetical protein [Candidatus Lloydbacteria bacterium]